MAPPVAGYTGWWDASQITGVADNTKISSWPDLSASGFNFAQGTGANQPTFYKTTSAKLVNGQPAVWFDGAATRMAATITQAQPFSLAWVAKNQAASGQQMVFNANNGAAYVSMYSGPPAGWYCYAGTAGMAAGVYDTSTHFGAAVFNGASSHVTFDGTDSGNVNTGAAGLTSTSSLGAQVTTLWWNGAICEVILYPFALSSGQISSLYSYLQSKWITTPAITGTAGVALGPLRTTITAGSGAVSGCARLAWLELNDNTLQLEDPAAGYFCTNLDVGFTVREVVSNRPDQHGVTDRTQYLGARVVSANITALSGAGARIDDVASLFAPYMVPSARPVLHYRLDRALGPERTLTVRASGYSWPVAGPYQRDIQLQWVAADPVAYDPDLQTATAGTSVPATIATPGDVPIRPLFRIVGPITGPKITLTPLVPPVWIIAFLSSFVVANGHYIEIDTQNRTVLYDGDPAKPRLSSIDWTVSSWQWIPPAPASVTMTLTGTATGGSTVVQAFWQDGYLT